MSTLAFSPTDLPDQRRLPFLRLFTAEARKLVDTRAGIWLLVGLALAAVVAGGAVALRVELPTASWFEFTVSFAGAPVTILLPVLTALSLTAEWTQRTALVTFALEPRRGRVIAAKYAVLAITALVVTAVLMVVGAASAALASGVQGVPLVWDLDMRQLIGFTGVIAVQAAFGAGLGLLLMNSAAAIVTIFVLPMAISLVSALSQRAAEVVAWFDLDVAFGVLLNGGTGTDWARAAVAVAVMVLVPTAVGVHRNLRREVA